MREDKDKCTKLKKMYKIKIVRRQKQMYKKWKIYKRTQSKPKKTLSENVQRSDQLTYVHQRCNLAAGTELKVDRNKIIKLGKSQKFILLFLRTNTFGSHKNYELSTKKTK